MSSTHESVKRAGRLTAICLKILGALLVFAICAKLFFIVSGLLSVGGQPLAEWGNQPVSSAVLRGGFDGTNGEMIAQFAANTISQAILVALLALAATIFNDAAKSYTPFSEKQSTRLKIISLLTLALAVLPPPIQMLLTMILSPTSDASAVYELTFLVLSVIFYSLAQVFDYGSMLQKQSDETL